MITVITLFLRSKHWFMTSGRITNYMINIHTVLTGKTTGCTDTWITPGAGKHLRPEVRPCGGVKHTKLPCVKESWERWWRWGEAFHDRSARPSACLCFQLPLEFTAGTCKGSHREVNGLQDKGQSCWERSGGKKQREREWGGNMFQKRKRKMEQKCRQDRQGVAVKDKKSAN